MSFLGKGKHFAKRTKNKLRGLQLSSVDFCEQGANPDADIALFKSAEPMEKEARTFQQIVAERDLDERFWTYQNAFSTSFRSILGDIEAGEERKRLMLESLAGFIGEMEAFIGELNDGSPVKVVPALVLTEKNQKEQGVIAEMKVNELNIDVSGLSAEEQAQLSALVEKVAPKPDTGGTSPATPVTSAAPVATEPPATGDSGSAPAVQKSAESEDDLPDPIKKAAARYEAAAQKMEARLKALDEKELDDVAKKYAPLGDDSIRETLSVMKAAGEKPYENYVNALERQMKMLEKTDGLLLGEIGKSSHGVNSGSSAVDKAGEIAKSIMEKNPGTTPQQAMAKAFEEHPELAAEYAAEYEGRK